MGEQGSVRRLGAELRPKRLKRMGTIVKEGNGFRARLPGARESVAYEPTYEAAEEKLKAAMAALDGTPPEDAPRMPLAGWMTYHLSLRERERVRDVKNERGRVEHHVVRDPVGAIPMVLLDVAACKAWVARLCLKGGGGRGDRRAGKPLCASTISNVVVTVRVALDRAVELGVIAANPMRTVRVPRSRRKEVRTDDTWTVLEADEQERLVRALDHESTLVRSMVMTALGLGLRKAELLHLRWEDVALEGEPWLVIRYGKKPTRGGRESWRAATKGGQPRRIPLFGHAEQALRKWAAIAQKRSYVTSSTNFDPKTLEKNGDSRAGVTAAAVRDMHTFAAKSSENGRAEVHGRPLMGAPFLEEKRLVGVVFPSATGQDRVKVPTSAFARALRRAGIDRNVRWQDLRHTCATSLLEGMWGPAWTVTEVQQLLRHKSATTTEKYLHARGRLLFQRARESYGFRRDGLKTFADEAVYPNDEGCADGPRGDGRPGERSTVDPTPR